MGRISKKDPLKISRELTCAARLAEMGARTGVICYWTDDLTVDRIKSIIKKVTGRTPPSGMLPTTPEWFRNNKLRLIQGKLFYEIYTSITEESVDMLRIEQFERAYLLFQDLVQETELTINNADNLIKLINKSKEIGMRVCKHCQKEYLEIVNERTTVCQSCEWHNDFICHTPGCDTPLPKHSLQPKRGKKRLFCDSCNLEKARARQIKSCSDMPAYSCAAL